MIVIQNNIGAVEIAAETVESTVVLTKKQETMQLMQQLAENEKNLNQLIEALQEAEKPENEETQALIAQLKQEIKELEKKQQDLTQQKNKLMTQFTQELFNNIGKITQTLTNNNIN